MEKDFRKIKVKNCSFKIREDLIKQFKIQARSEGYTLQEAINVLIDHYINDRITIKHGN